MLNPEVLKLGSILLDVVAPLVSTGQMTPDVAALHNFKAVELFRCRITNAVLPCPVAVSYTHLYWS